VYNPPVLGSISLLLLFWHRLIDPNLFCEALKVDQYMETNSNKKRTLLDYFWISARGFAMGAADVVPGVSGGTMAFILGIYDELLDAIHAVDMTFIRRILTLKWKDAFAEFPWKFLLAIALGIGAAILTLANALHWALENKPVFIWAFFFGLIIASIVAVRKRVGTWSIVNILAALTAAVGAYILVGLTPSETPHTPILLFLSGAVAICAMILPGISGAFILVLLGKYRFVLEAVKNLDILTIALVGLGAVVGLLVFVRLLRWMLNKNHDLVVSVLMGFMLGSLRKVWPWKELEPISETFIKETNFIPAVFNGDVFTAVLLMVVGIALVLVIEYFANRRGTT
jgi:putative membrane protein